jgi:hypothetical protein
MARAVIFAAIFCVASGVAFPATWSGVLVDSKCYAAKERNVNPGDTTANLLRDKYQEFWFCSPTAKTRLFAIALRNGQSIEFDSAGNEKAADFVYQLSKKSFPVSVDVSGEMAGRVISVDTISASPKKASATSPDGSIRGEP